MERGLPTSMQVSPEVMQTLLHGYLNNWAETPARRMAAP
jgi:hypothetical protein